jgi:hypothetical protein
MEALLDDRREPVSTGRIPDLPLQLHPLRAKVGTPPLELLHHP